jgi:DNA polymerase delta subunit 2
MDHEQSSRNPLIFPLFKGSPKLVSRVLDVVKGQLCFVIGTVYMDMPLKPNVLDDIGRDVSRYYLYLFFSLTDPPKHSIPAPPLLEKIHSQDDQVMLEDESGRIKLIGRVLGGTQLVTGVIVGVLGVETISGDFEAVDLCFPGMAPQAFNDDNMDIDGAYAPHASCHFIDHLS